MAVFLNSDFQQVYLKVKDSLPTNKARDLYKCFWLMEIIPFEQLVEYEEYWYNDEGFLIIGDILAQLSNRNVYLMKIWIDWVMENKCYYYEDKMPYGKYKGMRLCDIPDGYIKWAANNLYGDEDIRAKMKNIAEYFNIKYLKYRFQKADTNYTIGSLIKLYRDHIANDTWLPPEPPI